MVAGGGGPAGTPGPPPSNASTKVTPATNHPPPRTSTHAAPWHVVPAEDKRYARVAVVRQVCDAIEAAVPDLV